MPQRVTERKVLDPIKLDVENDPHPMLQNPDLPQGHWLAAVISPRGGGKTHLICELVRRMEQAGYRDPQYGFRKVPMRTVLISPTADSNVVFKSLKTLDKSDIVTDFTHKKFDVIWADIKEQKALAEAYVMEKDIVDRQRAGEPISTRELAIIHHLHGQNPQPRGRYSIPPVTCLILDDLAGSPAYKHGNNSVIQAALGNRHARCNIVMATQHSKAIPKALRNNLGLLAIGKFADTGYALDDLYEMVSSFLTPRSLRGSTVSHYCNYLCGQNGYIL
jgi:hypothetical protein